MNSRELKIKLISDELSKLEIQIRNLNSQNLCDLNIFCENLIGVLLNITFGYKLKNTNSRTANHPSLDLIDEKNRISVQISSDKSKAKVQKTLNIFSENHFYKKYDRLIFFVLGEKQKKYLNIRIPESISFDLVNDILDFKILLKFISNLPLDKVERIHKHLISENSYSDNKEQSKTSRTKFKQSLALRKRIEKDLVHKYTDAEWMKHRNVFRYDPSRKFVYSHLIIRSIDDSIFPEISYNDQGFPNWIKGELWDFYDNGLEFAQMISKGVIIDEKDNWSFSDDDNSLNCSVFQRIPFKNIVELDMEPDSYYGYPTLYVEYINGSPFEKKMYGLIGYYNYEKPKESRLTYYLDEKNRKNSYS